jgi:hypothetical protein
MPVQAARASSRKASRLAESASVRLAQKARQPGPARLLGSLVSNARISAAAAALFAQILEKHGTRAKIEPAGALTAGRISRLLADGAQLVCLSYLDADLSMAGPRLAVRRLRRRLPEAKILAGFWQSGPGQASELCAATKADFCATRFRDALDFCLKGAKAEAQQDEEQTLAVKTLPRAG